MRVTGDDRGQVAGIEAVPFGLLVFIAGALLIANIWAVVDTKFAADAAARQATRYVVESASADTPPELVRAVADDIARATMADHGRDGELTVLVESDGGTFERCQRVTVTVSTEVPAVRIPFVGGFGDPFAIVASHSELVDPVRSRRSRGLRAMRLDDRRGDRGSVLMLMPAAVLIVLLLGAIAVDSAIVYLGQRQAYNVAFDAANDAAGAGFDVAEARSTGTIVYRPDRVEEIVADAVGAADLDGLRSVDVAVEDEGVIAVTIDVEVDRMFGQAFGAAADETVSITARASAETGP